VSFNHSEYVPVFVCIEPKNNDLATDPGGEKHELNISNQARKHEEEHNKVYEQQVCQAVDGREEWEDCDNYLFPPPSPQAGQSVRR
jgi:hypothetical protein